MLGVLSGGSIKKSYDYIYIYIHMPWHSKCGCFFHSRLRITRGSITSSTERGCEIVYVRVSKGQDVGQSFEPTLRRRSHNEGFVDRFADLHDLDFKKPRICI